MLLVHEFDIGQYLQRHMVYPSRMWSFELDLARSEPFGHLLVAVLGRIGLPSDHEEHDKETTQSFGRLAQVGELAENVENHGTHRMAVRMTAAIDKSGEIVVQWAKDEARMISTFESAVTVGQEIEEDGVERACRRRVRNRTSIKRHLLWRKTRCCGFRVSSWVEIVIAFMSGASEMMHVRRGCSSMRRLQSAEFGVNVMLIE